MSHCPFLSCPFFAPLHQKKTLRQAETTAETRGRLPAGSPESSPFRSVIRSVLCFSGLSGDWNRTKYLKLCMSYTAYNMTGLLAINCYHQRLKALKFLCFCSKYARENRSVFFHFLKVPFFKCRTTRKIRQKPHTNRKKSS